MLPFIHYPKPDLPFFEWTRNALQSGFGQSQRGCRRIFKSAILLFLLLLLAAPSTSWAQVKFSALADPAQAIVGEPIRYRVTLESTGSESDNDPVVADWGGLTLRSSRPMTGSNTSISILNGAQSVQRSQTYEWELSAPRPGKYTIAPARITLGGQSYQTEPVIVEVGASRPVANIPDDFKNEPILSARTDDPDINRQLEGRLFLRAVVSNKTPYIREPVIITYLLYRDNIPLQPHLDPRLGANEGVLIDELSPAHNFNFQPVQVSGKHLQVAQMYRMAVTPTKPGKITIDGYSLRVRIPVQNQRSDPFNNPFFSSPFDNPFGAVAAALPSPPVELDVRPLPTEGKPADFAGTVGDFAISGTADRAKLSEDDLLTLRLSVEGKGAIDLAYPPTFPKDSPDFQLVGQSAKATEKANTATSIGGRKSFELVLRPKRAGDLHLPAIQYPIFNPATGRYVALSTSPSSVAVTPGKSVIPAAQSASPESGEPRPSAYNQELRFVHTLGATLRRHSDPILEFWFFWAAQLGAAALMLGMWRRHRRLATLDPARKRREGAWRAYERRLGQLRSRQGGGSPQELAGHFDQAARAYIADRFNLSADGLTRVDIERLLLDRAIPEARIQRLCDLLENCEMLRYAPIGAPDGELDHWVVEITTIFRENLRE